MRAAGRSRPPRETRRRCPRVPTCCRTSRCRCRNGGKPIPFPGSPAPPRYPSDELRCGSAHAVPRSSRRAERGPLPQTRRSLRCMQCCLCSSSSFRKAIAFGCEYSSSRRSRCQVYCTWRALERLWCAVGRGAILIKVACYTQSMSKRLQVLLPDQEMSDIQRLARSDRLPVGEWVRRTLREARANKPVHGPETKLKAVRRAAKHEFPSADMDQMLGEIERGYQA